MKLDALALEQAAEALNSDLGSLDDLSMELRNTLANIYYKFFAMSKMPADPSELLGYDNSDMLSTLKGFGSASADVLADFKHAKGLIESMREAGSQNKDIYEFLSTMTLDILKYKITNAYDKSGIRRAMERKLKKPNEIAGLYAELEAIINGTANKLGHKTI